MRNLLTKSARSLAGLRSSVVAVLLAALFLSLAAAPQVAFAEEAEPAAAEEGTQTVTFYHFEIVHYDDPTFEDMGVPELAGMRLIGTSTMEGLKPGDVVNSWEHVGTHPGFVFFDGWPHNFTVSDDPSKNLVQLNYFRASNDVTVNFYEASLEGAASQLPLRGAEARAAAAEGAADAAGEVVTETVGGQNVTFRHLGSTVRKGELFANVLAGDAIAEQAASDSGLGPDSPYGELTYAGSYPEDVFVSMDAGKNEINLVYTRPAAGPDEVEVESDAVTLPDDVYVEDDAIALPDSVDVESDAVVLPDSVYVEDDAIALPDDVAVPENPAGGSAGGNAGTDASDIPNGGSQDGPEANDNPADGQENAVVAPTQVIEKPASESGERAESATRPLPQTGDENGLVLVAALLASALAAVGAAVALRKLRR